jgi:hypothetical protein
MPPGKKRGNRKGADQGKCPGVAPRFVAPSMPATLLREDVGRDDGPDREQQAKAK